ncbi:putative bifunctional diguanylate cyclase/phosphodiesterase [Aeromonas dhakensis]|nr:GGDEF domain-containing phosphodiesterase [Aeromonas dhakensis]
MRKLSKNSMVLSWGALIISLLIVVIQIVIFLQVGVNLHDLYILFLFNSVLLIALFGYLAYTRYHLHYYSMNNQFTGLPGRFALIEKLEKGLQNRIHGVVQDSLAVVCIENLQDVSNTFGFEAADQLIVDVWQRISREFHPSAQVYHYQRERLAIIFYDENKNLQNQVKKLDKALEASFEHRLVPIYFSTKIGIVNLYGHNALSIINNAETAIEFARAREKSSEIYDSSMAIDRYRAMKILGSVRKAMKSGALMLNYQPKISSYDFTVSGFEALARWNDPDLGNISPGEFIPLIEKTDLIQHFSRWAIKQAITDFSSYFHVSGEQINIAVNISSHNLSDPDFPHWIRSLLKSYDFPSSCLELELTESDIMRQPELAIRVLKELSDIPMVISIDDFGTGYSSLSYLNRLPITKIKIDQQFTRKLTTDEKTTHIVSHTIALAHALNMQVIAEGVETEHQLHILKSLGCDNVQGFLFSPAIPLLEAIKWKIEPLDKECDLSQVN